ncbi:MAG: enoyl-CoA hydratase/isomerase family protein [Gammaproteobacteria bacterium]|uniref:enoyl-CoA hydratase/isomerase family protein n=1 Tax=Pseudomaricurvus alcaniphilus TaxID=1166482 RepID=UPI00140A33BE|nr:enoyl-CoA hydratase-related protein [Pseudomaricurvus alcaniphilus]MBR9909353.1 enoyl-CoA hydratase/isomerase family protein [Gammaproteobacteria bacterium]NHN38289.1 enoyl-CoA hydratase/isomerase family protein [Pseudomaricurvus alcaniphilus]
MADAVNPSVRVEKSGGIGWVVLTRPQQINAINDEIRFGVPQALRALDADVEISVIVIRGEGERGFCAGADIKEQRGPETTIEVRQRIEGSRWVEALDQIQKPVIAAIHGYTMGGGMELALACDIRFASPNAVMSLPETSLGLIPGGGGTQRLPRIVGMARALDLLLTGERLKAEDALAIGLVTRVASAAETHLQEVTELAALIAKRPPVATRYVKRATRASADLDLKKGLDLELDLFALLKTSEDAKEAAVAFKEKRAAVFSGK